MNFLVISVKGLVEAVVTQPAHGLDWSRAVLWLPKAKGDDTHLSLLKAEITTVLIGLRHRPDGWLDTIVNIIQDVSNQAHLVWRDAGTPLDLTHFSFTQRPADGWEPIESRMESLPHAAKRLKRYNPHLKAIFY